MVEKYTQILPSIYRYSITTEEENEKNIQLRTFEKEGQNVIKLFKKMFGNT